MHDVTPFLMLSFSSMVEQMPESFAVIKKDKKQKTEELVCKWKKLSSPQQTSHKELLAEKLPNSAQGQLHFSGRDKLVEKQLKSHLCHKPTQQLHPFQDEW